MRSQQATADVQELPENISLDAISRTTTFTSDGVTVSASDLIRHVHQLNYNWRQQAVQKPLQKKGIAKLQAAIIGTCRTWLGWYNARRNDKSFMTAVILWTMAFCIGTVDIAITKRYLQWLALTNVDINAAIHGCQPWMVAFSLVAGSVAAASWSVVFTYKAETRNWKAYGYSTTLAVSAIKGLGLMLAAVIGICIVINTATSLFS